MTDQSNPWTTLSSERRYESKLITLDQHEVRHRSGGASSYTVVHFKVVGVAVLPIDDEGFVHLVGQFRYASGLYTWELVRGAGDLSLPALDAAQRELREETGLVAEHWHEIFNLMASPGISDERAPCFVAWGLTQGEAHPDRNETLARRRIPFGEAVESVLSGEITDAPSVAAVLAVYARAIRGALPEDLGRLLRSTLSGAPQER